MSGILAHPRRAVMIKEFKQLTRDRMTYAMMLAMPVIQLLLFGYAINTEPRHLPTAVLVQEDSVFARSIVAPCTTPTTSTWPPRRARRPSSTS